MDKNQKRKRKGSGATAFNLTLVAVVLAVWGFGIWVYSLYADAFGPIWQSPDQGTWGQLGDFLGGVINPAIGIVTVALLAWSISIQRKELQASVSEMKDSNRYTSQMSFEQALFTWLQSYHSQIASIRVERYSGRSALKWIYDARMSPAATFPIGALEIDAKLDTLSRQNPAEAWRQWGSDPKSGASRYLLGIRQATSGYEAAFSENQSELDAPMRTLYRLFRWVDGTGMSPDEKWHYCALIRAQLSWIELVILFYNGLSSYGSKFAALANRYALFDNLQSGEPLLRAAMNRITAAQWASIGESEDMPKRGWPYTASAFSSELAKRALGASPDA